MIYHHHRSIPVRPSMVVAGVLLLAGWSTSHAQDAAVKKEVRLRVAPAAVVPVEPPAPTTPAGARVVPTIPTDVTVLSLANGGFVTGTPIDSPVSKTIRWESPAFARPLEFATAGVSAVRWPAPARLPEPAGEFRFEIGGGDVLFGSLVALDETTAEIDVPKLGKLHVERASLHRLHRQRDGAEMIYSGPNGLAGWREPVPKGSWREESGQILSDRDGSTLRGDLNLPARAVVEFELFWKTKPDFLIALGVGPDETSLTHAFRFEVWDGDLIIQREGTEVADLAPLGSMADRRNRLHLMAYLDQEKGRILVVAPDGRPLADLTVPVKDPKPLGGVTLTNVKGDVRLERLRIGRWDGTPPRVIEAEKSRIHHVDGSIAYGQVASYDPAARAFVLKGDTGESRVSADQIADVFLSNPGDGPVRSIRALYADGTQIGGTLGKIEAGIAEMTVPGIREPLRLPIEGMRSLVVLQPEPAPSSQDGRAGTLELPGLRLPGHMVEASEPAGAKGLAWQPDGGSTGMVGAAASGRIVYVEPKPPTPAVPVANAMNGRGAMPAAPRAVVAFNNVFGSLNGTATKRQLEGRRALHLRTGDVIPCDVTAIDEEGVRFKSSLAPGTFVAHAKVKAIELAAPAPDGIRISKAKRERMLTLPRMQKGSPPTQLIRSVNGDYLRGRVLAMDDKTLQVEVHLEPKSVPRDRVSRIIWFHADEIDPAKTAAPAAEANGAMRVQAIRSDGVRLTFRPEGFTEGALAGSSEVLGAVRVRLEEVDQLLIGAEIEKTAAMVAYGRWILHNAEEPKFATADAGGGAAGGTESPLVGKPAPDFELDLLGGGKKFRLSENKGQVIVLDFWATWCGPCIQAMPQVERVAKEFQNKGVKLIAVNLQEAPRDIKAMLERHKLDVTVALDVDGVVADRYNAVAIPQTVIIDKEGKVARLFVGGGADFDVRLREALNALPGMAGAEAPKP